MLTVHGRALLPLLPPTQPLALHARLLLLPLQAGFGHDFGSVAAGSDGLSTYCVAPAPGKHLLRVMPRAWVAVGGWQAGPLALSPLAASQGSSLPSQGIQTAWSCVLPDPLHPRPLE